MTEELIERARALREECRKGVEDRGVMPDYVDACVHLNHLAPKLLTLAESLSARVAELEGVLRQIQVGADRGLTQFSERQSGRRSPIWRSVNVLQDNLAACYGTALAALIKIDSDPALTKEAVVDGGPQSGNAA